MKSRKHAASILPGTATHRRAERIRERLHWEPGILNGDAGKPPWMRWRTFDRLTTEHDALVSGALASMALRLAFVPEY